MNYSLWRNHQWAISEIERLIVYERDVYVEMLMLDVEKAAKSANKDAKVIETQGFKGL